MCVQAAKTVAPGAKGCGWGCMVQGRTSPQLAGAYLNVYVLGGDRNDDSYGSSVEGIGLLGFVIVASYSTVLCSPWYGERWSWSLCLVHP